MSRPGKVSMYDIKLRRLVEGNKRLREEVERERIPVSLASVK